MNNIKTSTKKIDFIVRDDSTIKPIDFIKHSWNKLDEVLKPLMEALNVNVELEKYGDTGKSQCIVTMEIDTSNTNIRCSLSFNYPEEHMISDPLYVKYFVISKILVENEKYFRKRVREINEVGHYNLDIIEILNQANYYMVALAAYELCNVDSLPDMETRTTASLDQLGYRLGFGYNFITRHLIGLHIDISREYDKENYEFGVFNVYFTNTKDFYLQYTVQQYSKYYYQVLELPDNVDTSKSVFDYIEGSQDKVIQITTRNNLNLAFAIRRQKHDDVFVINGSFTYRQNKEFELIPRVTVEFLNNKVLVNTTLSNFENVVFGNTLD
jgi:hypothetical protein